ncbi:MAG: spore coat associated protein CotJA [Blautia wexlerae]
MLCQKHDRLQLYYTGCQRKKKHEMFSHLQYLEPAMAYVPCQKFTENFPLQYALNAGTIFPQLCKPFCGKRGIRR